MKPKLNIKIIFLLIIPILAEAQTKKEDSIACFRKPVAEFLLKQNEKAKAYEGVIMDKERQNKSLLTALQAEKGKVAAYQQDSTKQIENYNSAKKEGEIYKTSYEDEKKAHKQTEKRLKRRNVITIIAGVIVVVIILITD